MNFKRVGMKNTTLLIIDAGINFILGILLLLVIPFPDQIPQLLGVPQVQQSFYPSIMGAVFIGIGIALVIENCRDYSLGSGRLGFAGAIVINLYAGTVLMGWLIFGDLDLPFIGLIFL
jgi:hypothetical protein